MLKLSRLLDYDHITLQCHDNPDADAIGSAFALYCYLKSHGKDTQIVYSGFSELQKSNLVLMVDALKIPLRYIDKNAGETLLYNVGETPLCNTDETPLCNADGTPLCNGKKTLLVTVDCQYGAGNVKKLTANEIAVIDHHVKEMPEPPLCDIRPFLGSCSTLVWQLLRDADFDIKSHIEIGTALYYGLFTDTNNMAEITHPLDMDLRDSVRYDTGLIRRLKNSNLSMTDLSIAGNALGNYRLIGDSRSAVFEAEPCDPNILGFTSDLALQVDSIDTCMVFCRVSGGLKLSVRSCVRETMANELAATLCEGVGSGGGHKDKAGGFISDNKLKELGVQPEAFINERMAKYHNEYDHVYSGKPISDLSKFKQYRKKQIPIGFVQSTDVFPAGTDVIVRTLEGDTHITTDRDMYIMVGIRQEVWPIKREKFESSYQAQDGPYEPDKGYWDENHYEPTIIDHIQGESVSLTPHIRPCVPTGEGTIYVKELEKRTKVFTSWNLDGYMYGKAGDFLAVRGDDLSDVYVIEKSIFHKTYSK